jgi:AraC-like DNA-binding protein
VLIIRPAGAWAQRDSVYVKKYSKVLYYNSDSIFRNYAANGFIRTLDEIYYYYTEIVPFLDHEKQEEEIIKIRAAAKDYNSDALNNEANFMYAIFLPDSAEQEQNKKDAQLQWLIRSAEKREDIPMKLRSMEALFDFYWSSMKYAKAFQQALLLDNELKDVPEDDFPRKNYIYCSIGKAYYFFRDYDMAISYLRKALTPSNYYFDTSNILARNAIGQYYLMTNRVDSAEYYFRTALYSPENVKDRLMLDALSLSNIGLCIAEQKDYGKAASYLEPALSRMLIDHNYEMASRLAANLSDFYFVQNKLTDTKCMLDSAMKYLKISNNTDLYPQLYRLMSKYYMKTGNASLANAFLDSATIANKNYESKYSGLNILLAKQELFEVEKKAQDYKIRQNEKTYKTTLFYSFTVIVIVSLALVFLWALYRKNKRAYHALAVKAQDWAGALPKQPEDNAEPEIEPEKAVEKETSADNAEEYELLVQRANKFLLEDKNFKNLDITLDFLSKELKVSRNYLSRAINRTIGKNFNNYINEYRVKEAIRMMSDEKMNMLSIDAIALEVGFGNRISFYQAFKKITGLSPSEFRDNRN